MKMISLRATRALSGVIMGAVLLAAGPALGSRIGTCTTIDKPGSYVLTRNLVASGDCLVVAADLVTIDLAGWVITGDGSTGSGVTDRAAPREAIAVRNGTITGFEFGVSLGATRGTLVQEVRVIGNKERTRWLPLRADIPHLEKGNLTSQVNQALHGKIARS